MNIFQIFLLWCSGTDFNLIENCSLKDKWIQVSQGVLLLIPCTMAFFSIQYFITEEYKQFNLLIAFFWSSFIFIIDRYFVLTISKSKDGLKINFGILLRLLMSGLLGYMIAHPLLLSNFDASINDQFRSNQEKESIGELIDQSNSLRSQIYQNDSLINVYRTSVIERSEDSSTSEEELIQIQTRISNLIAQNARNTQNLNNLNSQISEGRSRISDPKDFWQKMEAFDQKKAEKFKLYIYEILMIILLLLFDTIPIIAKIFSPATNYDILYSENEERKRRLIVSGSSQIEQKIKELFNQYIANFGTSNPINIVELTKKIELMYINFINSVNKSSLNFNNPTNSSSSISTNNWLRLIILFLVILESVFVLWWFSNDPRWLALPLLTFTVTHNLFAHKY